MPLRSIPRDAPFLFVPPDTTSHFEEPPPPYIHTSNGMPHTAPAINTLHQYPRCPIQNCPQCKEAERREMEDLWRYITGPWTIRKLLKITKLLFIMLFIIVFALKVASHFHPIAFMRTVAYDIVTAAQDVFFILFVYPVAVARKLPTWSYHQLWALWADLHAARDFVPVLSRITARVVGLGLTLVLFAPFLFSRLVLRPLNWLRTWKWRNEVKRTYRGPVDTVMMTEAIMHFEATQAMRAAQDQTSGNGRRNRRRR
ncbi:hypothetical protein NM688_g7096 [Phlebia brevispora]|uniref:Uncharacterized protein n=1 Tax=Phlebia brevispora TaxID=194682 RepID=A0ACC1S941_9APHY|nr:hypothetical protein NM688_g7096 [Phlebia brevispora]